MSQSRYRVTGPDGQPRMQDWPPARPEQMVPVERRAEVAQQLLWAIRIGKVEAVRETFVDGRIVREYAHILEPTFNPSDEVIVGTIEDDSFTGGQYPHGGGAA